MLSEFSTSKTLTETIETSYFSFLLFMCLGFNFWLSFGLIHQWLSISGVEGIFPEDKSSSTNKSALAAFSSSLRLLIYMFPNVSHQFPGMCGCVSDRSRGSSGLHAVHVGMMQLRVIVGSHFTPPFIITLFPLATCWWIPCLPPSIRLQHQHLLAIKKNSQDNTFFFLSVSQNVF